MKNAVLARAFRGELGANAPMEESVVEILKSVFECARYTYKVKTNHI